MKYYNKKYYAKCTNLSLKTLFLFVLFEAQNIASLHASSLIKNPYFIFILNGVKFIVGTYLCKKAFCKIWLCCNIISFHIIWILWENLKLLFIAYFEGELKRNFKSNAKVSELQYNRLDLYSSRKNKLQTTFFKHYLRPAVHSLLYKNIHSNE